MKNYIDLHMHSNHSSDGEFTPTSILDKCYEANLKIIALTDHNSTSGIKEAEIRAKQLGIKLIYGTELDCEFKGVHLHVLAYGMDYTDRYFKELEARIIEKEQHLSIERLALTQKLGFKVTKEEMDVLAFKNIYTGEMFAEVLLAKPQYLNHPLLAPYRLNGDRSDNPYVNFYWDFYAQGKPCYTGSEEVMSLEKLLTDMHQRNARCVLAHPGNNLKGNFELFDEMVKLGLDGVEAFSNYHEQATNEYFYNKGREYNLLITCGSDYHGKTKPSIKMGHAGCLLDQEPFEAQLKEMNLI